MASSIQQSQIFRVQEWFSAGKSNTAAGFQIKDIILLQLRHYRINRQLFAHYLSGICRTAGKTFTAINAVTGNEIDCTIVVSDIGLLLTNSNAVPSASTFMGEKHQLRIKRPGFRIGTPLAAQGAAFEKNRRPDTFAVIHRQTLQLENITWFHKSFFRLLHPAHFWTD